jgi:hypothetical protein
MLAIGLAISPAQVLGAREPFDDLIDAISSGRPLVNDIQLEGLLHSYPNVYPFQEVGTYPCCSLQGSTQNFLHWPWCNAYQLDHLKQDLVHVFKADERTTNIFLENAKYRHREGTTNMVDYLNQVLEVSTRGGNLDQKNIDRLAALSEKDKQRVRDTVATKPAGEELDYEKLLAPQPVEKPRQRRRPEIRYVRPLGDSDI